MELFLMIKWFKRVLSQNAAVILQPESPKAFGTGWYEKLPIWSRLRFSTRWNVQDIARNKLRTVMSLAGIMTCSALIFAAFGFWESLDKETFDKAQDRKGKGTEIP